MAKCAVCGKGAHFGNNVSHSHRRSNRMFKSNIKSVRCKVNGGTKTQYVCARCLKSGKVERAQFIFRKSKKKLIRSASFFMHIPPVKMINQQQNNWYPIRSSAPAIITRSTVLLINSVINMPSATQNKEYPISLRNAFTSAKQKSIYCYIVYAFLPYYDSLLTEASSILLISFPAFSFASASA